MVHSVQFTSTDSVIRKYNLGPLVIEKAHPDHAFALYPSLRDVDKAEIRLASSEGQMGSERLAEAIKTSDKAFTISDTHGFIHGLWGHGKLRHRNRGNIGGYVWLVSDNYLMEKHGRLITRIARDYVFPKLDTKYSAYGNAVLSSNQVHRDWLTSAGFDERMSYIYKHRKFTLLIRGDS